MTLEVLVDVKNKEETNSCNDQKLLSFYMWTEHGHKPQEHASFSQKQLWFSVSILQSNNPREENLNFTFICWIKWTARTPDRYNMSVWHFTTFPISPALPECTSKQVTGLQWMLKHILVVSQTAQLICTLKWIRCESFDGHKIIKNIGLKLMNCFFLCLFSFLSSLPIRSLRCCLRSNNMTHKLVQKTQLSLGPRSSLCTLGAIAEKFSKITYQKNKRGKEDCRAGRPQPRGLFSSCYMD